MASTPDSIQIMGARTHNLRSVDVAFPHGKLTVITGVSGSGKSSLAIDTLLAEGQRRYLECLSPYARRFLDQWPRPDVDDVIGLPPTISVSQWDRPLSGSRRSTVATMTEIHDYLRILYARCGSVYCHACGSPIGTQSIEQITAEVTALPAGERIYILAPLVHGRKGAHREAFDLIRREGFLRARVDGVLTMVGGPRELDPNVAHDVEMVVDRQVVREGFKKRLGESLESAVKFGQGTVIISTDKDGEWHDVVYSTRYACLNCGVNYRELEPRNFSFNSPYGACETCEGLGVVTDYVWSKVIPFEGLSLDKGAIIPFSTKSGKLAARFRKMLRPWKNDDAALVTPVRDLSEEDRRRLWEGDETFAGLRRLLEKEAAAVAENEADPYSECRDEKTCPDCNGGRLRPESRQVRVDELPLHELTRLTIQEATQRLHPQCVSEKKQGLAEPLLRELQQRLQFLNRVGVGYVELDRPVATLSGGEAQRIRLARCVGSGLSGACYVLDEPTIGLHARDTDRLLDVLDELRRRDNTVIVVEHDEAAIRRADLVVDVGPGAGVNGGRIVRIAPPDTFASGDGLTADYLSGKRRVRIQSETATRPTKNRLVLRGVRHRNLANIEASFPLESLIAVTGVSGSGKSSLVLEVLAPALRRKLGRGNPAVGEYDELAGWEELHGVVEVDQRPIGRSPRSTPATFCGLLDPLRRVFAKTKQARLRGFTAGRFSFNAKQGQCSDCRGLGARKLDFTFLPDDYVTCPTCRGRRFNQATLQIRYRGLSIADVLDMSVDEAVEFFKNHQKIFHVCETMASVGLGYLKLGQWGTTLSGGEAQRLKLAAELCNPNSDRQAQLFVLDEPTTGLHFHDVARLLDLLRRLVAHKHTVIVVEHHLDVIRQADWVVDLGPEGGAAGGRIIATGPPALIAACPDSFTGRML